VKTNTLHCDGPRCGARVEMICEPLHDELKPQGWVKRIVLDEFFLPGEGARHADFLRHYCPDCLGKMSPPLHASLWEAGKLGSPLGEAKKLGSQEAKKQERDPERPEAVGHPSSAPDPDPGFRASDLPSFRAPLP